MKIMQITRIDPNWKEGKASLELMDTNFNNGKKFIYDHLPGASNFVNDGMLQNIMNNQIYVNFHMTAYETTIQSHITTKGYTIPLGTNFPTLQGQYDAIDNAEITAFVDETSPTLDMLLLTKIVNNEKNFANRRVNILRVLDEMRKIIFETYKVSETLYLQSLNCNGLEASKNTTIVFTTPTTKLMKNIVNTYFSKFNTVQYATEDLLRGDAVYNQVYSGVTNTSIDREFEYTLDAKGLTDTIILNGTLYCTNGSGYSDIVQNNLQITADTYLKTVTSGDLDNYVHKNIYDSDFNFDFVISFEV